MVAALVDEVAQFLNVVDLGELGSVVGLFFSLVARISFGSLLRQYSHHRYLQSSKLSQREKETSQSEKKQAKAHSR